jgi:hypothetical protein
MFYAGIGARNAPQNILDSCMFIAQKLESMGYTLRSGGADGCDSAFEAGAINKEIYLPWKGFNHSKSELYFGKLSNSEYDRCKDIASKLYPGWDNADPAVKKLHARNVLQILGPAKTTYSAFVICWTNRPPEQARGTMFGVHLAHQHNIPVYNLYIPENVTKLLEFLKISNL